MKINFKKVATVLGSALMVGSTVAMAAAASFPAPFVQSGSANVAVVVGAQAALSDAVAATSIGSKLATELAAQTASGSTTTSSTTVTGGDSYKIEKTSQKFQLGTSIADIKSSLDDTQLPTLLKQGKFIDKNNDEFDYKQSIDLADLPLEVFNDRNYAKDTPTIGFMLNNEAEILNYTLEFTDKPYFSNLETTDLPIMGKTYYVLDVTSDNKTITLLDSASDAIVAEGTASTLKVGDKSYEVSVWVGQSGSDNVAKVTINGQTTNSLKSGQTQKLADGAYVGIKDIMYSSKESAVSQVELSIGSGKLKIENGAKVEMNDESVKNVYGYITNTSNTQINTIMLKWTANDKTFIAKDKELSMPGFGAVKLSFAGMNFPAEEKVIVEASGDTNAQLTDFPLKNGAVDIPIVGKASGNVNYTYIGSDTDALVVTNYSTSLTFDGSSDSNDDFLIASWTDGSDAESYLIRPVDFNDPTSGSDTVGFEVNDGSGWTKKYDKVEQTDDISFGNLDLNVAYLNSSTGNQAVTLTRDSDSSFDVLYTKQGLKVQMPYANTTAQVAAAYQASNITGACSLVTWSPGKLSQYVTGFNGSTTCTQPSFTVWFTEENKDSDIAAGQQFNVTIGNNGASNYYTSVTGVGGYNSSREKSATDVYEEWTYSPLATKIVEDNSGEQDMATITYHGGESFGDVFVTAPQATVAAGAGTTSGSATELGSVTVYDNEAASVSGKNLIVVGGSCINSVAAELLGVSAGALGCQDAFSAKTGIKAGEALIKSFDKSGKVALLVAGYDAADTTKAATYLVNTAVDTTVGKALKVTSATEATAITA